MAVKVDTVGLHTRLTRLCVHACFRSVQAFLFQLDLDRLGLTLQVFASLPPRISQPEGVS